MNHDVQKIGLFLVIGIVAIFGLAALESSSTGMFGRTVMSTKGYVAPPSVPSSTGPGQTYVVGGNETNATCGNGVVESGEQCEFNNQCSNGRVCRSCSCRLPPSQSGRTRTPSIPPPLPVKQVFVTSTDYFPVDLRNSPGFGNTLCNAAAASSNLTTAINWAAWTSAIFNDTNGTPLVLHAKNKLPNAQYFRLDGVLVANSKADLIDGTIQNPIKITEQGTQRVSNVWTGTASDGTATGKDCDQWQVVSASPPQYSGTVGLSEQTNETWTNEGPEPCAGSLGGIQKFPIYCFQR